AARNRLGVEAARSCLPSARCAAPRRFHEPHRTRGTRQPRTGGRTTERLRDALAGFLAEAKVQHVDLIVTYGTSATLGIAGRLDESGRSDLAPEIPKV